MDKQSIEWIYYPKCEPLPELLRPIIATFESVYEGIKSSQLVPLKSNQVLEQARSLLETVGFSVEKPKGEEKKVKILEPVLFGRKGRVEKSFELDAYDRAKGIVLEVEAGVVALTGEQAC